MTSKDAAPGLARRATWIAAPAVLWISYSLLIAGYALIRGFGDSWLPVRDGEALERALLRSSPPHALQAWFGADNSALALPGLLLHLSWFWVPPFFGIFFTLLERRKLAELFGWIVVASYLSNLGYLLFPLSPPWMHDGVTRVLAEQTFFKYSEADNNPYASFPSMHAGLGMVIALFCFMRADRLRWMGWIALADSLLLGFWLVYLGEHWVVDIVAGYALAGAVAFLFCAPSMHALYARIPGRPVERIRWLNEQLSAYRQPPKPIDLETERTRRRAA